MRVEISGNNINFSDLKSLYLCKSGRNNGEEIWTFPDKYTPDIDFTDEAAVQCDIPL